MKKKAKVTVTVTLQTELNVSEQATPERARDLALFLLTENLKGWQLTDVLYSNVVLEEKEQKPDGNVP